MTLPALVATDLDGTLLRTDGTLSARSRTALAAVEESGVHIVVVTARPPRWMHDFHGVVGRHGVALCANGAYVYHVHERRVLIERTLPTELALHVAEVVREALPGTAFAVETSEGFGRELAFVDPYPPLPGMPVAPLHQLLELPVGKLLARNATLAPDAFLNQVRDVLGEQAVLAYSGADGLAEISAPGVTKAVALADWCDRLGVAPEAVWTFGDMPNDLSMLTWAGRGYAVANAHPEVLAAADAVCPSNDDDGVARTLEAALAG